jgi:alpha-ketoglutarate-dependent taurine dioxygenase
MSKLNSTPQRDVPDDWKIDVRDYKEVGKDLEELLAHRASFLNFDPENFTASGPLIAIVSRIRNLLSNVHDGVAILNLGTKLGDDPELIDRAKLLIMMIGSNFGCTVTRNHLGDSPFFPIYHRKEGKGTNYIGNGLSNNQPGIHTDGSAWRKARVDLLTLLSISRAAFGGATIVINALQVFEALPSEVQRFFLAKSFIRQDPFDPLHHKPVRRTVYHNVETRFYSGLGIKYHRARIEGGHEFLKESLKKREYTMLNILDRYLSDARFRREFFLESGQIIFLNNNFICHDRTEFRDSDRRSRLLYRYWAGALY